jgi:hypothetical protein
VPSHRSGPPARAGTPRRARLPACLALVAACQLRSAMRSAAAAALRLRRGAQSVAELPRALGAERGFAGDAGPLKRTPLYDYHVAHGGKMVPFAGWEMPIQYKTSIMESTKQCRTEAVIFDVSHMCGLSLRVRAAARRVCGEAAHRRQRAAARLRRHLRLWRCRAAPLRAPRQPARAYRAPRGGHVTRAPAAGGAGKGRHPVHGVAGCRRHRGPEERHGLALRPHQRARRHHRRHRHHQGAPAAARSRPPAARAPWLFAAPCEPHGLTHVCLPFSRR